ncbi:DPH5 [Mytilus edulis]|uniref:diphthine methyl ester synthase n=1 Tax=Mytilus edulis TaxID=6550 RepID=A0A8S3VLT0_MYTED|nr:DPH5 [Mytilus edulis]
MMFYFIGLGLGDAKDITVKGLEIVKKSKRVYLEAYTSILTVGKEKLEEFYGREVILADRDMVETQSDEMFEGSDTEDVSFLVVGDPFGATTHTDLVLRAKEKDLEYRVIHNASIMNAVGCCGLQKMHYFFFYDKIKRNRDLLFLHTLCLLDIKVKEQSIENLMKGKKIFEPPRYMSVNTAAEQLVEIIQRKKEEGEKDLAFTEDTICIGLARIGSETQTIIAATFTDMMTVDIGAPLHSFVIPGELHPLEKDMLKLFAYNDDVKQLLNS